MTPLPSKAAPDLLPCPFCNMQLEYQPQWTRWYHPSQPACYLSGYVVYHGTKAVWNTRPSPPSADADAAIDRAYIEGAKVGFNLGEAHNDQRLADLIEGRMKEILALRHTPAATTDDVVGKFMRRMAVECVRVTDRGHDEKGFAKELECVECGVCVPYTENFPHADSCVLKAFSVPRGSYQSPT